MVGDLELRRNLMEITFLLVEWFGFGKDYYRVMNEFGRKFDDSFASVFPVAMFADRFYLASCSKQNLFNVERTN